MQSALRQRLSRLLLLVTPVFWAAAAAVLVAQIPVKQAVQAARGNIIFCLQVSLSAPAVLAAVAGVTPEQLLLVQAA